MLHKCNSDECTNIAVFDGYCKKCTVTIDKNILSLPTKKNSKSKLIIEYGGSYKKYINRCTIDDCNNLQLHYSKLCHLHFDGKCTEKDCDKDAVRHTWCAEHNRYNKTKFCNVDGCNEPIKSTQKCLKHQLCNKNGCSNIVGKLNKMCDQCNTKHIYHCSYITCTKLVEPRKKYCSYHLKPLCENCKQVYVDTEHFGTCFGITCGSCVISLYPNIPYSKLMISAKEYVEETIKDDLQLTINNTNKLKKLKRPILYSYYKPKNILVEYDCHEYFDGKLEEHTNELRKLLGIDITIIRFSLGITDDNGLFIGKLFWFDNGKLCTDTLFKSRFDKLKDSIINL
jgi:hypothetical protein